MMDKMKDFFQKRSIKIWWFQKNVLPLHSLLKTKLFAEAPLAQLVEQLTLNQWV